MADINEVFDAITFSEDRIVRTGYEEGYKRGSQEGEREGFQLGLEKGSEVGQELGFYRGFAEAWLQELGGKQEKKFEKTIKQLEKLLALLEAFPSTNVKESDGGEKIREARARFKTICSVLQVSPQLNPNEITW